MSRVDITKPTRDVRTREGLEPLRCSVRRPVCPVDSCGVLTREDKPYCTDHVHLMPYLQAQREAFEGDRGAAFGLCECGEPIPDDRKINCSDECEASRKAVLRRERDRERLRLRKRSQRARKVAS